MPLKPFFYSSRVWIFATELKTNTRVHKSGLTNIYIYIFLYCEHSTKGKFALQIGVVSFVWIISSEKRKI